MAFAASSVGGNLTAVPGGYHHRRAGAVTVGGSGSFTTSFVAGAAAITLTTVGNLAVAPRARWR